MSEIPAEQITLIQQRVDHTKIRAWMTIAGFPSNLHAVHMSAPPAAGQRALGHTSPKLSRNLHAVDGTRRRPCALRAAGTENYTLGIPRGRSRPSRGSGA